MSKTITKTLAATLAATLGTGMVPAMAQTTTNLDELHKATYNAVEVAKKDNSQKAINDARVILAQYKAAIEAQEKLGLLVHVNTFSTQLDGVQQPILSNIVTSILAMKEAGTATQAEINAVRTLMEGDQADKTDDLPAGFNSYKKTWSAELDVFQNIIIDAAVVAVKLAETEMTQTALDSAKVLVADLATAVRVGIKDFATKLQDRLDAVVVYNLKVTKAEITKTGVTVTFDALEEAQRDVEIEVLDNNGNAVPVEAKKLLIEGETTWTFKFVDALKERAKGVWTVNGLKVDLEGINLVADVKKAGNADALYIVLEKTTLVSGLVDEVANQEAYLTVVNEMKKAEKLNTVEDVQKAIDDANKNVIAQKQVAKVIKTAKEGTLNQFKSEFAKLDLERVNSEWIVAYREGIKVLNLTDTLSLVQGQIDAKNISEVTKAEADLITDAGILSANKIEKAIGLVEEYVIVEKDNEVQAKAKALRIHNLEVKLAVVGVNESDTQVSLKSALGNLEKVVNDKKIFEYNKLVNESLMADYVKAKTSPFVDVNGIVDLLSTTEKAQIELSMTKIAAVSAEVIKDQATNKKDANKAALMDAYKELATVSAKALDTKERFDASIVKEDLFDLYAKITVGSTTLVSELTTQVKAVNNDIVGIVFSPKDLDATNLLERLQDSRIGLTNIIVANEEAYIAELTMFKTMKNKNDLVNAVDVVNSKEVIVASDSVATVKAELTKIAVKTNLVEFIELRDAQKTDIAELVIARIADANSPAVEDCANLLAALTEVNKKRIDLLSEINVADTITKTIVSLTKISPEFKALDDVTKVTVAEKFNATRPVDKDKKTIPFLDFTAIRTLVATCMK